MLEPTGGRLQLDINSLLVNIYIYTYRQLCWERGNTHCVRPLGRMHTILVIYCGLQIKCAFILMYRYVAKVKQFLYSFSKTRASISHKCPEVILHLVDTTLHTTVGMLFQDIIEIHDNYSEMLCFN